MCLASILQALQSKANIKFARLDKAVVRWSSCRHFELARVPAACSLQLQPGQAACTVLISVGCFVQEKNLEQDLWHQVFYKCIIEFRSRLASSKAGGAKTSEAYAKVTGLSASQTNPHSYDDPLLPLVPLHTACLLDAHQCKGSSLQGSIQSGVCLSSATRSASLCCCAAQDPVQACCSCQSSEQLVLIFAAACTIILKLLSCLDCMALLSHTTTTCTLDSSRCQSTDFQPLLPLLITTQDSDLRLLSTSPTSHAAA